MPMHHDHNFLQDNHGFYTTAYGPFVLRSAFQPIFSQNKMGRLKIEAFEALIRPSRNGNLVSPGDFFPLVDKSDALDVDRICRELHILNMGNLNRQNAQLFINLNPSLLNSASDIRFEINTMTAVAQQASLHPNRIVCEITEQRSSNATILNQLVEDLRFRQFKIAVDDYGAEGSDTKRVDELKPDILKFDAHWVHRFIGTTAGKTLLQQMVERFIKRNIIIVFEGLEQEHQINFCLEANVALMQGFALARPAIVPENFDERFPDTTAQFQPHQQLSRKTKILPARPASSLNIDLQQQVAN